VPRLAWSDDNRSPPPKNCWLSSSIILTLQVLNPGARNGSPSVMEGLVCLCLEAAPGYISLAISAHPRRLATIASPLHTLFHTVPVPSLSSLSQRLRILDKSRGLGCDPLVCEGPRSSLSLKRPPLLYHHYATRFFYLIPLYLLSSNSRQFRRSLYLRY